MSTTNEQDNRGTTLYYPYIHPRKIDHLKAALVYWDRVRRIVPNSLTHGTTVRGDDDDARHLVGAGLLLSTSPGLYEDSAAERFFKHIQPKSKRFQISKRMASDMARRNRGIHLEKIGHNALAKMHKLGLAHTVGDWVSMDEQVGAFYMFCLASEMSQKMSAPLLSDSQSDATIGKAMLFESDTERRRVDTLLGINLNLPTPEQVAMLSPKAIAKFCHKRADEKRAFREAVEGIIKQAQTISDPHALADYLTENRVAIAKSVKDLRESLDEIRVGAVMSAAKISVPSGLAAAVAGLKISSVSGAILGVTGIVLSLVSCFAETRGKLRHARASSPYHYLLSIKEDLRISPVHK